MYHSFLNLFIIYRISNRGIFKVELMRNTNSEVRIFNPLVFHFYILPLIVTIEKEFFGLLK